MFVDEQPQSAEGWPSWTKWAAGICLLYVFYVQSIEDDRPIPANPTYGLATAKQVASYRQCMERRFADFSDYEQSELCRLDALGALPDEEPPTCYYMVGGPDC